MAGISRLSSALAVERQRGRGRLADVAVVTRADPLTQDLRVPAVDVHHAVQPPASGPGAVLAGRVGVEELPRAVGVPEHDLDLAAGDAGGLRRVLFAGEEDR